MEKMLWVDETLGTDGTPTEIQAAKEDKAVVPEIVQLANDTLYT